MSIPKHKLIAAIVLVLLVPVGFYTKLYSGPFETWVNNKLGGVFYEMFWIVLFFVILDKVRPFRVALWVFIFTSILEFAQLLKGDFLDIIRSNFIGQTLLGNSFSWSDFPYYILGSFIGFLILSIINQKK